MRELLPPAKTMAVARVALSGFAIGRHRLTALTRSQRLHAEQAGRALRTQ
jgi:hypothetical protein